MSIRTDLHPRTPLLLSAVLFTLLPACDPYPDQGEFLAGVIYDGNMIAGVKAFKQDDSGNYPGAVGGGAGFISAAPFTLFATTGTNNAASKGAAASSSPLWTDGTRDMLAVSNAQQVYVFDGGSRCQAPDGYKYDERLDLVRMDRQYPIFNDLPEVLPGASKAKVGRGGSYNAIVQIVHVTWPQGAACQSIKRGDTVMGRIGMDLQIVSQSTPEYRLLQVFDPALTIPPVPSQLGWFNQLVLPYIDMGPVPLAGDGAHFAAMPVYAVSQGGMPVFADGDGNALPVVAAPGAQGYSPVCQDYTLTVANGAAPPPPNAADPAYAMATPVANFYSCLVCSGAGSALNCPFASSGAGAK